MRIKSMFTIVCLCAALSAGWANPVQAGSPEKRQKIVQLMKQMDMMAIVDSSKPMMSQLIVQDLTNRGIEVTPGLSEKITDTVANVMKSNLRPYLAEVLNIYDNLYTEAEIDDLIAFYGTPTGQKTLRITPELTQKVQLAAMQWSQALGPKIGTELQAMMAEQKP